MVVTGKANGDGNWEREAIALVVVKGIKESRVLASVGEINTSVRPFVGISGKSLKIAEKR